jgi:hypothetical protein
VLSVAGDVGRHSLGPSWDWEYVGGVDLRHAAAGYHHRTQCLNQKLFFHALIMVVKNNNCNYAAKLIVFVRKRKKSCTAHSAVKKRAATITARPQTDLISVSHVLFVP